MIHPINATTCGEAWLKAAQLLSTAPDRCAYNVVLGIDDPIAMTPSDRLIARSLDQLLVLHDAHPIATVAGTIFPAGIYRQNGLKGVVEDFPNRIYPKIKEGWGTYAGRMLTRRQHKGWTASPLEIIIDKLKHQLDRSGPMRAIYELGMVDTYADLPLYDSDKDATRITPQPCLVHLSFKLRENRGLMLTALYRNHYYVQKAYGNLIGLSQLLYFVAKEAGTFPQGLVCHSTYARLDIGKGWSATEVDQLLLRCAAFGDVAEKDYLAKV